MNSVSSQDSGSNKLFWLLVLIAYCISVGVRYYYVILYTSQPQYFWNDTLMINTNDGYYFAETAQQLISGELDFSKVRLTNFLGYIATLFYYTTPFSLEQIMLYAPGFLGSLVVIPVMVLARPFGYFPALLGGVVSGICVSYYNRTMFGYFDTDMLILPLAMAIVAVLITLATKLAKQENRDYTLATLWRDFNWLSARYKNPSVTNTQAPKSLLFPTALAKSLQNHNTPNTHFVLYFISIPLFVMQGILYYQSLQFVFLGFFLVLFAYLLFFERSNFYLQLACAYYAITLYLLDLLYFTPYYGNLSAWYYKSENYNVFTILLPLLLSELLLIIAIVVLPKLPIKQEYFRKYTYYAMLVCAVVFLYYHFDEFFRIFSNSYIAKQEIVSHGFQYYSVFNTIAEINSIDFTTFSTRIAGSPWLFILSSIGLIIAFYHNRFLLLLLPLLVLGYFAYFRGLRFTIYAVPVYAIGFSAFLWVLLELWKRFAILLSYRLQYFVTTLIVVVFSSFVLTPMGIHIKNYLFPPVFNNIEVEALDELSKIANPNDLAIAWWDYGYPIRYYGHVKTYVDGAIQDGASLYPISLILTGPNTNIAYNTSILVSLNSSIWNFANENNLKTTQEIMDTLSKNLKFPKPKQDTYIILPTRMTEIFPTVVRFSQVLLENGKILPLKYFNISSNIIREDGSYIHFSPIIRIKKATGEIEFVEENLVVRMYAFITVERDSRGKNQVKIVDVDKSSQIAVVFMKEWGQMFIMDREFLNSLFVQGAMFEALNPNQFQMVSNKQAIKIYKVLQ